MSDSELDYENPNVVRINSIAISLVLCFFVTVGGVWLLGRRVESVLEPTIEGTPTPVIIE